MEKQRYERARLLLFSSMEAATTLSAIQIPPLPPAEFLENSF
jgi:hypothetical protein